MPYLIRYAELALKGKNRGYFEKQLVKNIKFRAKYFNKNIEKIERIFGRIIVYGEDLECLQTVFGVSSISKALELPQDIELLKKLALEAAKKKLKESNPPATFVVKTQRLDKNYPKKSIDISRDVGEIIHETLSLPVTFKNPDLTINIEIFNNNFYLSTKKINCFGGLPVGVEGFAKLKVENDRDVLAGLLMMKRGCGLIVDETSTDTKILEAFGHYESTKPTEFKINSKPIKAITNYDSLTSYPIIAYSAEKVENELRIFRKVYDKVRS